MDDSMVFYNPRDGPCTVYIQQDAPAGWTDPLKAYIEYSGGFVTADPSKAVVIVIVDRKTKLGTKLINDYSAGASGQAVDFGWVQESIRQSRILGPPEWGGFQLRPHTVQSFFEIDDGSPAWRRSDAVLSQEDLDSSIDSSTSLVLARHSPTVSEAQTYSEDVLLAQRTSHGKVREVASKAIERSALEPGKDVSADSESESESPVSDSDVDSPWEEPSKSIRTPRPARLKYTDTEIKIITNYFRNHAKRKGTKSITDPEIVKAIHDLIPWRTLRSVDRWLRRHPDLFEKYYSQRYSHEIWGRSGSRGKPRKKPSKLKEKEVHSIINALIEDQQLDDVVCLPLSPPGDPYDRNDCLALIQFMVVNAAAFLPSLKESPSTLQKSKMDLWKELEAEYNTRSAVAWAQIYLTHRQLFDKAAIKLVCIRSKGSGAFPSSRRKPSFQPQASRNILAAREVPRRNIRSDVQGRSKRLASNPDEERPSKRLRSEEV